jgi:peptidoglycan/xylan/chitin deacetylase (PgdA/CDA1 family)
MRIRIMTVGIFLILCIASACALRPKPDAPAGTGGPEKFSWPKGKKAAVSLTFDDARPSQIDNGMLVFKARKVRATFYIQTGNVAQRLAGWKKAVKDGHEIGNHTMTHPCTGNYAFSRKNALEEMTLDDMAREIDTASREIEDALGVRPESFAYPCGQTFVGRGRDLRSYVPLVAERFLTGRLWLGEAANDPEVCDPFQLLAVESDGKTFDELKPLLESAAAEGRWLVLAGHEIGDGGFQTTLTKTVDDLCRYATDPANGLWIDTVGTIGRYVIDKRGGAPRGSGD